MFVQDFKTLAVPYDDVAQHFRDDIDPLLHAAIASTRKAGEQILIRVGPEGWPEALAKTVEIHPGPIRPHGDGLLVAFWWEATGDASLFPRLDADIEVAPFGTNQTAISLQGRYDPPAGALGRMADQVLLHRIAESTIRAFLESICAALATVPGSFGRGELKTGTPDGEA